MKRLKQFKIILPILGLWLIMIAIPWEISIKVNNNSIISPNRTTVKARSFELISQTPITTPTLPVRPTQTATPTIITSKDMNQDYGPCAKVSVLMYHHIQDEKTAKENGQTGLTVTPDSLRKHLQYLKDNHYNVISMANLKDFFDNGVRLPDKPVLITIDDGYKDNYDVAYPILKEFNDRATIFVATGLLDNPGYMTWEDINHMKDLIYFANHTWSHHGSVGSRDKLTKEIVIADQQLIEHGLNQQKIFAYPYGTPSKTAKEILKLKGYGIAFTTVQGDILCKGKSLELPRIRVGNASLKSYGL